MSSQYKFKWVSVDGNTKCPTFSCFSRMGMEWQGYLEPVGFSEKDERSFYSNIIFTKGECSVPVKAMSLIQDRMKKLVNKTFKDIIKHPERYESLTKQN